MSRPIRSGGCCSTSWPWWPNSRPTSSDLGLARACGYNLRRSKTYLRYRVRVQHTQRSQVSIAERRKPDPQGKPGYLRVDTVHQGQHDGQPGLYHLNAVDTVTQWEIVGCVE